MANPWVAIDAATDLLQRAKDIAVARERVLSGAGAKPPAVRDVIAASWERCADAGVDPDQQLAPVPLDDRALEARRATHPLGPTLPVIRSLLGDIAVEARHVLVVSDAEGHLLWVEGHPKVLKVAETMHFVPGSLWSEAGAGTNAIGTTLAVDHPMQVFSAEHLSRIVHPWTCAGAPIHDPDTGELLGAVDVTGGLRTAHPHTLTLVTAAARMAEEHLRVHRAERDLMLRAKLEGRIARSTTGPCAIVAPGGRVAAASPDGWLPRHIPVPREGGMLTLPDGRRIVAEPASAEEGQFVWLDGATAPLGARTGPAELRLRALGRGHADAWLGGRHLMLSPRHSEILVALALHPEGLTGGDLADAVYGPGASPVTVRAELTRLRRLLGPWFAARPYRVLADVRADFLEAGADLAELLPGSKAPAVLAARAA